MKTLEIVRDILMITTMAGLILFGILVIGL